MALNHLSIPHELIESLTVDPVTEAYVKNPDLLRVNPKGLVPTLVVGHSPSEIIKCESIDIVRDLFEESGTDKKKLEAWCDDSHLYNRLVSSPFYRVLMKQDKKEKEEGWADLLAGLNSFSEKLEWRDGSDGDRAISFYGSQHDSPCMVDFVVFPWVHRLYLLEHYCGYDLINDVSNDVNDKIRKWQSKMEMLECVKQTLAKKEDLIPVYRRYSDGTAKSQVGAAVRAGKDAHSIEKRD